MANKQKGFRLSDDANTLLELLAKKLGLRQVHVVETAIRQLAKAEGVSLTK